MTTTKIAYCVQVHKQAELFIRLIRAIWHPENLYAVHVDRKASEAVWMTVNEACKVYSNVILLSRCVCRWGAWSLVESQLKSMQILLENGLDWSHWINLSGQDFPLKSPLQIHEFLKENPNKSFIRYFRPESRPDWKGEEVRIERIYIESFFQ